jgi:voltage-gated potassium channel
VKLKLKREISVIIVFLIGIVAISGLLFYVMESEVNPDINSYRDGLWLAAVTASSVGYGDVYPVTLGGQVLASMLGFTGLVFIGVTSALTTAYFVKVRV